MMGLMALRSVTELPIAQRHVLDPEVLRTVAVVDRVGDLTRFNVAEVPELAQVSSPEDLLAPDERGWALGHALSLAVEHGQRLWLSEVPRERLELLRTVLGEQAAELASFTGTGVLASSIVSSRLLRRIAQAHGLAHRNTLTGFKWISRVPGLVFGYEEALGYCVDPASVRDKDGISAAVRLAALAGVLKQQGRTLPWLLDRLAREHGLHATSPLSVRVSDPSVIPATMERLRAGGGPAVLAGSPVVDVFDLLDGASDGNGGRLPPTDGLIFKTAADDRVVIRPSGTEPKLKCYCEVVVPVAVDEPVEVARRTAAERLELMRSDLRGVLGI